MREVPRPFLEKHQATPGNQGKDNHHRLEEPLRDRMHQVPPEVDAQQNGGNQLQVEEQALPVDEVHASEEGRLGDIDQQEKRAPTPISSSFSKRRERR